MQLHPASRTLRFGAPLAKAEGAVILVHGRGSSADDIAGLAPEFQAGNLAYIAPSASGGTWYPQRFFVPIEQNEPWLSSALSLVDQLVEESLAAGIPHERIGLVGFSQGACLILEYAVRNPRRYGFVAGLSGALIGPITTPRTPRDFGKTPVLIACAERDPHIPLEFVKASAKTFTGFEAEVTTQIFPGGSHMVFPEEIVWIKNIVKEWISPETPPR